MSLSNLALLGGSTPVYNDCKKTIIKKIMEEYKNKKLKGRDGKVITNRKQALAIGLNEVNNKCNFTKSEMKDLINKVNKDLNNSNKEINLSNLIEVRQVLEYLDSQKSSKRIYIFRMLLWDKIVKMGIDGIKLNKNMWEEIQKINEI